MTNEAEVEAMRFVRRWAESHKIRVKDVSHEGLSYDYQFTYQNGKTDKVEVKGVSKPYGIPDMRVNEFLRKRLKADYLLIVANIVSGKRRRLYKILREDIKPSNLKILHTYRITRFQGRRNMEKHRLV